MSFIQNIIKYHHIYLQQSIHIRMRAIYRFQYWRNLANIEISDMQTCIPLRLNPPPPPHSESDQNFFSSQKLRNVLKRMQKNPIIFVKQNCKFLRRRDYCKPDSERLISDTRQLVGSGDST